MNELRLPISNLTIEQIQTILAKNGLNNAYKTQNGDLFLQQSDVVKVSIRAYPDNVLLTTKFPTIGNIVQIIVSIIMIVLLIGLNEFLNVGIPFPALFGIALGQLFSYFWFLPKIKSLQQQVKIILENERKP